MMFALLGILYLFTVNGQSTEKRFDYVSITDAEVHQDQYVYKYVNNIEHESLGSRLSRQARDLNLVDKMLQNEPPDHVTTTQPDITDSTTTKTSTVHKIIDLCTYSHINARVNECFQANTNCSVILDCINSMNLVEVCNQSAMYTPTIWILNVYEVLQNLRFCSTSTSQCSSHENQYLIKLDEVMRTLYIYGSSFLDKPKEDSKQYCAKADHLVTEVKDLFDIYDYCFDPQSMNEIKSSIDELADNILDRDCRYCISSNIFFENCIYGEKFYHFSNFLCNDSVKCIYDKIEFNNCDKDKDTPLKLITTLIKNLTDICEYDSAGTASEIVKEWLMTVDSCIKERSYIGLEMSEAPQHVDYCNEIEQTSQCIRGNIHMILKIKPSYKDKFLYFFHQFEKLQLACDATQKNLSKIVRPIEIRLPDGLSETPETTTSPSEQLIMEDKKNYYEGKIFKSTNFKWIEVDSFDFLRHGPIKDIEFSHNYLKATIVKLKFKFPFYGHSLDKIIIATGGFLYVGSLLNPLITKAQYIAPLMANFDPNLNANRSSIIYVDNSTHFICTWERLMLRDQIDNGEYTFQVILNKDGQIIFNYKRIPSTRISSLNHEVKVGLSDAYTFYKLLSFSKIEYTIVQYNVVNIQLESLQDNSSIHFAMLPNCIQLKSCDTCIKGVGSFKCLWCPILNRCSDTLDRYRQEWLEHSCPTELKLQTNAVCSIQNTSFNFDMRFDDSDPDYVKNVFVGIMVTILLSMFLTVFGWMIYAYKNPNSPSGMWLIDHRPRKLLDLISTRLNSMNGKEVPSMTRLEEQNA